MAKYFDPKNKDKNPQVIKENDHTKTSGFQTFKIDNSTPDINLTMDEVDLMNADTEALVPDDSLITLQNGKFADADDVNRNFKTLQTAYNIADMDIQKRLDAFEEKLPKDKDFLEKVAEAIGTDETSLEAIIKQLEKNVNLLTGLSESISSSEEYYQPIAETISDYNFFLTKVSENIVTEIKQNKEIQELLKGEQGDKGKEITNIKASSTPNGAKTKVSLEFKFNDDSQTSTTFDVANGKDGLPGSNPDAYWKVETNENGIPYLIPQNEEMLVNPHTFLIDTPIGVTPSNSMVMIAKTGDFYGQHFDWDWINLYNDFDFDNEEYKTRAVNIRSVRNYVRNYVNNSIKEKVVFTEDQDGTGDWTYQGKRNLKLNNRSIVGIQADTSNSTYAVNYGQLKLKADKTELTPWIVGEYKQVSRGTKMPEGWVRVNFETLEPNRVFLLTNCQPIDDGKDFYFGPEFFSKSLRDNEHSGDGSLQIFNNQEQEIYTVMGIPTECWEYQPSIYEQLKEGIKVEGYSL